MREELKKVVDRIVETIEEIFEAKSVLDDEKDEVLRGVLMVLDERNENPFYDDWGLDDSDEELETLEALERAEFAEAALVAEAEALEDSEISDGMRSNIFVLFKNGDVEGRVVPLVTCSTEVEAQEVMAKVEAARAQMDALVDSVVNGAVFFASWSSSKDGLFRFRSKDGKYYKSSCMAEDADRLWELRQTPEYLECETVLKKYGYPEGYVAIPMVTC